MSACTNDGFCMQAALLFHYVGVCIISSLTVNQSYTQVGKALYCQRRSIARGEDNVIGVQVVLSHTIVAARNRVTVGK